MILFIRNLKINTEVIEIESNLVDARGGSMGEIVEGG